MKTNQTKLNTAQELLKNQDRIQTVSRLYSPLQEKKEAGFNPHQVAYNLSKVKAVIAGKETAIRKRDIIFMIEGIQGEFIVVRFFDKRGLQTLSEGSYLAYIKSLEITSVTGSLCPVYTKGIRPDVTEEELNYTFLDVVRAGDDTQIIPEMKAILEELQAENPLPLPEIEEEEYLPIPYKVG